MKTKSCLAFLLPICISLSLIACSKIEYDYKALGFVDKTEMESAFSKGYHTQQKLTEMMSKVAAIETVPTPTPVAIEPIVVESVPQPVKVEPQVVAVNNSPFAPSFDCAKVSNGAERLSCSDRELSNYDVELTQLYLKIRESTQDKDTLKSEQIEWIKSTRNACAETLCMVAVFKQRISELSKKI